MIYKWKWISNVCSQLHIHYYSHLLWGVWTLLSNISSTSYILMMAETLYVTKWKRVRAEKRIAGIKIISVCVVLKENWPLVQTVVCFIFYQWYSVMCRGYTATHSLTYGGEPFLRSCQLYSKCHVTSNKAKSNLECTEEKFQTRGWVWKCEKWKVASCL
jgi:hypothetical protein